ncbi:MAG: hypothetical protein A3G34_03340 [Candidatus Lindowbacteria bacterium RIFCSPLOWO2_12_FULL_62_27]|nr:MAG: hypothetical protein A3I06_16115 [Candidatus Lindowbacteria bacterium RIFCSPLOWO2_02_FULL_62_12]OGH62979.1 MAG: hypothetical protein A3G34_03340 [Candidatus Lindowbacteria bacterium RIFCSPLOWO2_12_FULL_62_27]
MNSEDRRLLLAFVLSLIVFASYQMFLAYKYPPPKQVSGPGKAGEDTVAPTASLKPIELASPQPIPISPVDTSLAEETTVLSGNGIELTATNLGAGLRQIRLPGIARLPHRDTRDVILVDETWRAPCVGLRLPGTEIQRYRKDGGTERQVRYVYEAVSPQGSPLYRVERTIELSGRPYEARLETRLRNLTAAPVEFGIDSSHALGLLLAPLPRKSFRTDLDIHELFLKLGKDIEHWQEQSPGFFDRLFGRASPSAERRSEVLDGVLRWICVGDRYFTVSLIPDSALTRAMLSMDGPTLTAEAQYGVLTAPPGGTLTLRETLYAGPKNPEYLTQYGEDLLDIMKFGWFDWLGFWMLRLMNLFHKAIPNYGVSILLLTCIVRVVLYPLTYKSYASMAKLKELTPKMKVIQDKYKDNKEKLNKELMRLYKDNKVNPAGGCLPILLQIPVFIAFYNMLQYAIELRGASFLWVLDLSERDPYYILPVLMGASMLIQQKLTPSPDPNQAKIGMMMTVIFTFLFLTFPAGLNLYWFVSTVLGIWQQKIIERKLKPVSAAAPAQPAKSA